MTLMPTQKKTETKKLRNTDRLVNDEPFDPLHYENIGKMIRLQLADRPLLDLDNLEAVSGAGIYALYYIGELDHYRPLVPSNAAEPTVPIYVGKAIPQGGRKGLQDLAKGKAKRSALAARLAKHRSKISNVVDLKTNEFKVRYLPLTPVWIALGENALIREFKPVWNVAVDGFGNNALGKGRIDQSPSAWDYLHRRKVVTADTPVFDTAYEEMVGRVRRYFSDPAEIAHALGFSDQDAIENLSGATE
ncbi:Eco29kI family restriction endonuclease [Rhizobium ruizarguesonis]|nr:Eco29kI family restriction endonuclease [Rhizobium ruizarguesonis]